MDYEAVNRIIDASGHADLKNVCRASDVGADLCGSGLIRNIDEDLDCDYRDPIIIVDALRVLTAVNLRIVLIDDLNDRRMRTLIDILLVTDFSDSAEIDYRRILANCIRSDRRLLDEVIYEVCEACDLDYRIETTVRGLCVVRS